MILRTVRPKSEPDDTASTFVGLAFWAAAIVLGWLRIPEVEAFFAGLETILADDAALAVYGPFNRDGAFSSDSNREFETWLKARDPRSGIRDFDAVNALAEAIGLRLVADIAMPANNRILVWRRSARP